MAAQPQAFASESKNISHALVPEFDHEMANTRKSLERVPDNKLSFKPHARSMTLGGLATHLATINHWTEAILGVDSFDVSTAPPTPELKTMAEVLAAFDKNAAAARKAIAGATDAQLMKPWALLSKGQTIFTLPRAAVLRSFILSHTIHHRAQLGVYLRLNDIAVPSIYGPSADEGNM
ncbi:MAG: DinB family protein [Candidatus Angelobacter sp.]